MATSCFLSRWLLDQSGQRTLPLSLGIGVSAAFLMHYGWRAFPAVVVGQLAVWFADLRPADDGLALSMTLLSIVAAWGSSALVDWVVRCKCSRGAEMQGLVFTHLGIPILAMMPYGWLRALIFVKFGRIHESEFVPMFMHTCVNSVLAILIFGTLVLHVLQGDVRLSDLRRDAKGVVSGALALALLALTFNGVAGVKSDPYLPVFLPFPLVVITAVWLAPASTSVFAALWCLLSVSLFCFGRGPFAMTGLDRSLNATVGLGLYNIVIASIAYFVSLGSFRLVRQLNLNEIATSAAGVELWEWDDRHGFSSLQGRPLGGYLRTIAAGLDDRIVLSRLEGSGCEFVEIGDAWRAQKVEVPAADAIFGSAGRILQRGRDHRPTHAIGLLQDLTATRKADLALAELGLQKARVRKMQAKLNPHFLFNSLNVIRALIHIDKEKADRAISSLGDLMRINLRTSDALFARLEDELLPVRTFIELAQLRFGDRIRMRIDVPTDLFDISIPPMLLLNLVENAVTHGIGSLEKGGNIEIVASVGEGQVRISVRNTGTLREGFEAGIGTQDAKQRLELLFGAQAGFTLSQIDASTVSADITIPYNHSLSQSLDPNHSSLS